MSIDRVGREVSPKHSNTGMDRCDSRGRTPLVFDKSKHVDTVSLTDSVDRIDRREMVESGSIVQSNLQ
jgi:hypothetical protein